MYFLRERIRRWAKPAALCLLLVPALACSFDEHYNPGDPSTEDYYILGLIRAALEPVFCDPTLVSAQLIGCPAPELTGTVRTYAGQAGSSGTTDAFHISARFNITNGCTTDGSFLYLADASNSAIRKINLRDGEVTTLNTFGGVIRDVVTDGTTLYAAVSGENRIYTVDPHTGASAVLAGSGAAGTLDGNGTSAQFSFPHGITVSGNQLYVAQVDHVLRRIDISTAEVTTIVGLAATPAVLNGTGTDARLAEPIGLAVYGEYLYIAERGTISNVIRRMNLSTTEVTTYAGIAGTAGTADGDLSTATFTRPYQITTEGKNLYIAEQSHIVRKINLESGLVTTLAGMANTAGSADGTGTAAQFDWPRGICTDGTYVYVSDSNNHTIRRIE